MEENRSGKKTTMILIAAIAMIVFVLFLNECSANFGSNGNVSAPGDTPVNTSIISDKPTQATDGTTAPTNNTTPTSVETLPQEATPSENAPPATEAKLSEPTTTESAHAHNYSALNTTAPTCTAQGYTTFICSCGASYLSNATQATGHSWGDWTVAKEATTSVAGEQIRTCAKCGATESQMIAQLPSETPSEPAVCQHNWEAKWYPEEGHYTEHYCVCKCGFRFNDPEEWGPHLDNYWGTAELVLEHTSWGTNRDWIVDSPERWEWICSKCGAISVTQP